MPVKFTIPLKIIELDIQSFHLLVEAKINNIPLNLIIDTGASRTVFDRKILEERLRFTGEKTHDIQSAGIMADQIESRMGLADIFMIGNLNLKDYPVILIDLDAINKLYMKVTGITIHGLLGSDFLVKMKAVIDYKKLLLILRKPE
jgi:hypothetical protein